MIATQPELWPEGWDLEPPRRVDFGGLLDRACKAHAEQRQRWVDAVQPDAWVSGRPAFNVPVSIDDWPGGES